MADEYITVLIFLFVGVAFTAGTLIAAYIFRRFVFHQVEHLTKEAGGYECGEEPIGAAWVQFNMRYYIFALLFVVFDVEVVFLYPWAVVFSKLGVFAFIEMLVFLFILIVGFAYAWAKGALKWE